MIGALVRIVDEAKPFQENGWAARRCYWPGRMGSMTLAGHSAGFPCNFNSALRIDETWARGRALAHHPLPSPPVHSPNKSSASSLFADHCEPPSNKA